MQKATGRQKSTSMRSKKQVSEMLNKKIIQHSDSQYNALLWIVPKKINATGKQKWRIVIDFRRLNQRIIQDAYPLLVIEDILNHLENACSLVHSISQPDFIKYR